MTAAPHALRAVDAVVAFGCWVIAIGALLVLPLLESSSEEPISTLSAGSIDWWFTVAALTGQAILLKWSRFRSRAVLLAVAAVPVALAIAAPSASFSLTGLAVMVAIFGAVLRNSMHRLRITLPSATVMISVGCAVNGLAGQSTEIAPILGEAVLQSASILALPLLVGIVVASRRDARLAHQAELRALARERDALVRAAVAGERTDMARELHDIAAHHLSGIALMAVVADRQIDSDPDAAHDSVRQIRTQSKSVLDDLRRLVGLLRDDTESPERSVETLATVPALTQSRRAAGIDVELRLLGAEDIRAIAATLGPLAQLVVYRMVQEALANAAHHAPLASCVVELDASNDRNVTVTVSNTASGPGIALPTSSPASSTAGNEFARVSAGGFGLIGMRERAELVGGRLRYGPTEDGGWTVVLSLPCEIDSAGQREENT